MSTPIQRSVWDGHPVSLGTGFTLTRPKAGRELTATCGLWSHQLGWELRLEVNGLISAIAGCRSRDEVLDTCEQWRAAMIQKGWR